MAIYHHSTQVISRSDNRNVVACAAYRSGSALATEIVDVETGISVEYTFDYSSKHNVEFSEIVAPSDAPKWVYDRKTLWNEVERVEKRKDSQLAREIDVAFPKELSFEQCKEALREYVNLCFVSKGMIADCSVHWEDHNPHAHIMLTMRDIHKSGFGLKNREWNSKSHLLEARELWASCINSHLEKNGFDTRIDHRSYKNQGIDLTPTIHEGVEKVGSGWKEKIAENERIREENLIIIKSDPEIILRKVARNKVTFTKADIAKEVFNLTLGKEEYFEEIYNKAICSDSITIATKSDIRGIERFVFKEYEDVENKVWNDIDSLESRAAGITLNQKQKVRLDFSLTKLSQEQRAAVGVITRASDISILIGRAGTGKTTTLDTIARCYDLAGYNIKGGAISGIASDNLVSSFIESKTLAKWLFEFEKGSVSLNSKDVFIVDEASMVDIDTMHKLVSHITKAKAKLMLVGDDTQIQPIGRGGAFRGVLERVNNANIATLSQVWRQNKEWQRDLTEKMAARDVREVISAYEKNEIIKWEDTKEESIRSLVSDYVRDYLKTDKQNNNSTGANSSNQLVLTYTSDASRVINNLIRDDLKAAGAIEEKKEKQILSKNGYIDIAPGDKLLFLQNNKELDVRNGQIAKVLDTSRDTIKVAIDSGDKSRIFSFNVSAYNNITHGYSVTTHKAQGKTVDKAYILAESNHNYNSFNVAITRHKEDIAIYANKESHKSSDHLIYSMMREDYKELLSDYADKTKDAGKDIVSYYLESVEDCKIYYSEINSWAGKENKSFAEHSKWGKYLSSLKTRETMAKQLSDHKTPFKPLVMQAGLSYTAIDRHAGKVARSQSRDEVQHRGLVKEFTNAKDNPAKQQEIAYVILNDIPSFSRYFSEYKVKTKTIKDLSHKYAGKTSHSDLSRLADKMQRKETLDQEISVSSKLITKSKVDIAHLDYKNDLYAQRIEKLESQNKSEEQAKYLSQISNNHKQMTKLGTTQDKLIKATEVSSQDLQSLKQELGYFAEAPQALNRAITSFEKDKSYEARGLDNTKNIERPQRKIEIGAEELHGRFTSHSRAVSEFTEHLLGKANKQLSSNKELRFGRNGKIVVNLEGERAGLWYDFTRDTGGNLYTMLREERGLDIKESKEYLANFIGVDLKAVDYKPSKLKTAKLIDKEYGYDQKKLEQVKNLISNSQIISNTIARDYLQEHRKINLSKINLSDDIRFSDKVYSSEDKQRHPALIAIARNVKTEATATQSIYLDKDKAGKDDSLSIHKRSSGYVKGSFVELTNNKYSDRIYIAEGVETGLSIAQAAPEARVICTLGISNMKNIDLSNTPDLFRKEIILCADNDENNKENKCNNTRVTMEAAGRNIKELHSVKYVAIITPDKTGQDFNDVLCQEGIEALKEYTKPFEEKLDKQYAKAHDSLEFAKNQEQKYLEKIDLVFADKDSAITRWNDLVNKEGLEIADNIVKKDPETLGKLKGSSFLGLKMDSDRTKAIQHKGAVWRSLDCLTGHVKSQRELRGYISNLYDKHIAPMINININNIKAENYVKTYEKLLTNASVILGDKRDFTVIKELAVDFANHINHVRAIEGREPTKKEHSMMIDRVCRDYSGKVRLENRSQEVDKVKDTNAVSKNMDIDTALDETSKSKEQGREKTRDER